MLASTSSIEIIEVKCHMHIVNKLQWKDQKGRAQTKSIAFAEADITEENNSLS